MPRHRLILLSAILIVAVASFLPLGTDAADEKPAADEELTKVPVPTKTVYPEYPKTCLKQGVSGIVLVAVIVSEKGIVAGTEILEGVEECPDLETAAVTAAEQWQFEPGEIDGEAVTTELAIPFEFALQ